MILHDIKEKDSVLRDTAHNKLSILIGMDSFSYVVYDPGKGLFWYRSFSLTGDGTVPAIASLEKLLRGEVAFQKQYALTSVIYHMPHFTVIPDRLYRPEDQHAYLQHLTPLTGDDLLETDDLPSARAHLVYRLPATYQQLVQEFLPHTRSTHLGSLFVNHLNNLHFSGSGDQIYLYLSGHLLYALYFREGQFVFHNTFTFRSSKDCLYYVLLLFNQFNLDQEQTTVHLCGQLLPDSEIYRLLQRYLGKLETLELPMQLTLADPLREYPEHFYFDHALNLL